MFQFALLNEQNPSVPAVGVMFQFALFGELKETSDKKMKAKLELELTPRQYQQLVEFFFIGSVRLSEDHHANWGNSAVNKWKNGGVNPGENEWALSMSGSSNGSTAGGFSIESGTTKYHAIGGDPVDLNKWYHLVGMREGDSIRYFKNGELIASTYVGSLSVNNVGRDIRIASIAHPKFTNAIIDDFAYYQKSLTEEEVAQLYNAGCDFYTPQLAYRYGFNGMEKDNELKDNGNSYDFGARMHDPRVGRWLSVDKLAENYSSLSPYTYVGNMPIIAVDPNGKEIVFVIVDNNGNVIGEADLSSDDYETLIQVMDEYKNKSKYAKYVIENLESSNTKIQIAINTAAVENITEGEGDALAYRPDATTNTSLIIFKDLNEYDDTGAEQAMNVNEELFHQYQYIIYGLTQQNYQDGTSKRTGPELEAEAKVYDVLVVNDLGKEFLGFPSYMNDLIIPGVNDVKGAIDNESQIQKDGEYWDGYLKYLSNFELNTSGKYAGKQGEKEPKTYNKVIKESKNQEDEDN